MEWYKDLYVGELAEKRKYKIINKIEKHKTQIGIYVLTLPFNNENVLDIYPSYILNQKYYKKADLKIMGIACGYDEALEVMERIIMDCYHITNQFK
ncbi:MAG: hypothetical protein K2M60_03765, partial [Lachnospiraceae bacterium]|nr:hypothetical protein [Lachnospiraceae bacterium]